jgi:DNA polymerase V
MNTELEILPENKLSLQKSTYFLIRVNGDSMINAGIHTGDYLLVDRSFGNTLDSIIIAEINGKWTVKTYLENKNGAFLMPQNPKYKPIPIAEADNFKIIGKVVKVIKSFN